MQSILRVAMLARAIPGSFTLVLLLACGPSQQKPATTEAEPSSRAPRQNSYADNDGVSEKGKEWGGWRYQGKSEDCFYTVKRQCFVKKADACKAAGCADKSCRGNSSAPVKISCKQ